MKASKEAGTDYYEISAIQVEHYTESRRKEIKNLAESLELGLAANGGFGVKNDIASEDDAIRRRGIEEAKRIIQGLSQMGISSWSGINYGAWKQVPEPGSVFSPDEKRRIWERSVQSLREIMKTAQDYQVTMCLEIVNRYEQYLINTVYEGVEMARAVDSPCCKLLLDSYHMNIEEDSFREAIFLGAASHMIGEVHVSEPNRKVPGTAKTHMDWADFFGGLKEISYEGIITMEPFLVAGYPISSKICIWRNLSGAGVRERFVEYVKTGAEFVRNWYTL